jgi:hypothetical protein
MLKKKEQPAGAEEATESFQLQSCSKKRENGEES